MTRLDKHPVFLWLWLIKRTVEILIKISALAIKFDRRESELFLCCHYSWKLKKSRKWSLFLHLQKLQLTLIALCAPLVLHWGERDKIVAPLICFSLYTVLQHLKWVPRSLFISSTIYLHLTCLVDQSPAEFSYVHVRLTWLKRRFAWNVYKLVFF